MTTTEPWVSVEDVAKHLGVARDSVYRWIESRGLPAHKVGRIWKFKLSQVDAWVEAGGAKADDDGEVRQIHFGDADYRHDYSPEARKAYLARSAGIRDGEGNLTKDDPLSANFWSRRVLWRAR